MLTPDDFDRMNGLVDLLRNNHPYMQEISACKTQLLPDGLLRPPIILQHYQSISPIQKFLIDYDKKITLTFTEAYYSSGQGRDSNGADIQAFVSKKLDANYNHIIIRPETWEDKLRELFVKMEIDVVDFPEFSMKYYFLAENKEKGIQFATSDRLKLLTETQDLHIEILGDIMVAKYNNNISEENLLSLIRFIESV